MKKMSVIKTLGAVFPVALLLSLLSVSTVAANLELSDFPGARVVYSSQQQVNDYVLALSNYKKINGIWQAERAERLSGMLTRRTYELPDNHTAEEGYRFVVNQLKSFPHRELYSCVARTCGASNVWANDHFKQLQLYGLDQYQAYSAYEVTDTLGKHHFVTIYAVQRGNKRIYMQLDILSATGQTSAAANPQTLVDLLDSKHYFVYADKIVSTVDGSVKLNISATHLDSLLAVLAAKPHWRVALVGHDYSANNIPQQQKQSLAYADQLKAALVARGVNAQRLESYGLGSLAPAGRVVETARVEVVLIP